MGTGVQSGFQVYASEGYVHFCLDAKNPQSSDVDIVQKGVSSGIKGHDVGQEAWSKLNIFQKISYGWSKYVTKSIVELDAGAGKVFAVDKKNAAEYLKRNGLTLSDPSNGVHVRKWVENFAKGTTHLSREFNKTEKGELDSFDLQKLNQSITNAFIRSRPDAQQKAPEKSLGALHITIDTDTPKIDTVREGQFEDAQAPEGAETPRNIGEKSAVADQVVLDFIKQANLKRFPGQEKEEACARVSQMCNSSTFEMPKLSNVQAIALLKAIFEHDVRLGRGINVESEAQQLARATTSTAATLRGLTIKDAKHYGIEFGKKEAYATFVESLLAKAYPVKAPVK